MNTDTDKKTQPCDCIEKCGKFWVQRCDCHNGTNLAEAEAWCRDANGTDELQVMREAIKEAHAALSWIVRRYDDCKPTYQIAMDAYEMKCTAAVTLAKLKPFVSPEP